MALEEVEEEKQSEKPEKPEKSAKSNKADKDKENKDVLFVKGKVRDYCHSKDCNASGDLLDGDAFNNVIKEILDKAVDRAKGNNRKTVMEKDL